MRELTGPTNETTARTSLHKRPGLPQKVFTQLKLDHQQTKILGLVILLRMRISEAGRPHHHHTNCRLIEKSMRRRKWRGL
jgi:hypothetical protein